MATKEVHFKKKNMPIDPSNRYIGFYHLVMNTLNSDVTLVIDSKKNPDPGMLWTALINLDKNQWQKNLDDGNYSNMIRCIVRRFRPYVPDEYKINDSFTPLDKHAEVSNDAAKEFIEFMVGCIDRLEDYLANNYVNFGAKRHLDVLERKWKSGWSNQPNKSIEVKQSDSDDKKLDIRIVDA